MEKILADSLARDTYCDSPEETNDEESSDSEDSDENAHGYETGNVRRREEEPDTALACYTA